MTNSVVYMLAQEAQSSTLLIVPIKETMCKIVDRVYEELGLRDIKELLTKIENNDLYTKVQPPCRKSCYTCSL